MPYSDRELKNATQVAYADFDKLLKDMPAKSGGYSIQELMNELVSVPTKHPTLKGNYDNILDFMKDKDQTNWNDIKNWKIVDTHDTNVENGFYGCVIDTGNGNAIVGFRGSEGLGDMSNLQNDWINADLNLLSTTLTKQQEEAERFMKEISTSNYIKNYDHLALTGHSLGGNLADHATITSNLYGLNEKITQTISYDGPGFSEEYIQEHRDQIQAIGPKMKHFQWSTVGNLLQILPSVEFHALKTKEYTDLTTKDYSEACYNLIGKHDTMSTQYDECGNAIYGETDAFSAAMGQFSRGVDHMPKIFGDVMVDAISVLLISVTWAQEKMFDKNGLTPFGWVVVIGAIGLVKVIGLGSIVAFAGAMILMVAVAIASIILYELVYEAIEYLVGKVIELLTQAWNWTVDQINQLKKYITNELNKYANWLNSNLNIGFKYASANPEILVDTEKMRGYAARLNHVNNRIVEIDHRMDSLYAQIVDIKDLLGSALGLLRLLRADILVGYSVRLQLCANYLNDTAQDFDNAEQYILAQTIKN